MLQLYHNDMSVCAQKVRHLLEEKGLPWQSMHMSLRHKDQFDPDYLRLNPNGVVPTLVHDGKAVIESTIITEYLEDEFPETAFRPSDNAEKARMRYWTKQLDDSIHAATVVVTVGIGIRHQYEIHSEEELNEILDAVPNSKWRVLKRQLIENGMNHPDLPDALIRLKKMLDDMEGALTSREWLVGSGISLADIGLYPYVMRVDHLNLGDLISRRPNLASWYERMSVRPACKEAYLGQWLNEKYVNDLMEKGGEAKKFILSWLSE